MPVTKATTDITLNERKAIITAPPETKRGYLYINMVNTGKTDAVVSLYIARSVPQTKDCIEWELVLQPSLPYNLDCAMFPAGYTLYAEGNANHVSIRASTHLTYVEHNNSPPESYEVTLTIPSILHTTQEGYFSAANGIDYDGKPMRYTVTCDNPEVYLENNIEARENEHILYKMPIDPNNVGDMIFTVIVHDHVGAVSTPKDFKVVLRTNPATIINVDDMTHTFTTTGVLGETFTHRIYGAFAILDDTEYKVRYDLVSTLSDMPTVVNNGKSFDVKWTATGDAVIQIRPIIGTIIGDPIIIHVPVMTASDRPRFDNVNGIVKILDKLKTAELDFSGIEDTSGSTFDLRFVHNDCVTIFKNGNGIWTLKPVGDSCVATFEVTATSNTTGLYKAKNYEVLITHIQLAPDTTDLVGIPKTMDGFSTISPEIHGAVDPEGGQILYRLTTDSNCVVPQTSQFTDNSRPTITTVTENCDATIGIVATSSETGLSTIKYFPLEVQPKATPNIPILTEITGIPDELTANTTVTIYVDGAVDPEQGVVNMIVSTNAPNCIDIPTRTVTNGETFDIVVGNCGDTTVVFKVVGKSNATRLEASTLKTVRIQPGDIVAAPDISGMTGVPLSIKADSTLMVTVNGVVDPEGGDIEITYASNNVNCLAVPNTTSVLNEPVPFIATGCSGSTIKVIVTAKSTTTQLKTSKTINVNIVGVEYGRPITTNVNSLPDLVANSTAIYNVGGVVDPAGGQIMTTLISNVADVVINNGDNVVDGTDIELVVGDIADANVIIVRTFVSTLSSLVSTITDIAVVTPQPNIGVTDVVLNGAGYTTTNTVTVNITGATPAVSEVVVYDVSSDDSNIDISKLIDIAEAEDFTITANGTARSITINIIAHNNVGQSVTKEVTIDVT